MARAVHREPAEINMDYVNLPESSARVHADKGNADAPGRKLFRLVGVGFGLLCILQAALNVSLRLTVFKSHPSSTEKVCRNETDEQKQLIGQHIDRGWLHFHTSLYYISQVRSTWHQSRQFCRRNKADLVIINTKEEQDFTRQFHRLTWIGLHNQSQTGMWTWVDGTLLSESFSFWGEGEPNGFEGKTENCVEIRFFEKKNSWNDIPCEDQNFWICERKVAP